MIPVRNPNGRSFPIGATVYRQGVNFSVYSRTATSIELLFFDAAEDAVPARVIPLERRRNRTRAYWHAFVPGIAARTAVRLPRPWRDRLRPAASGSTATSCCSTPMVGALRCRANIPEKPPSSPATTPRMP